MGINCARTTSIVPNCVIVRIACKHVFEAVFTTSVGFAPVPRTHDTGSDDVSPAKSAWVSTSPDRAHR